MNYVVFISRALRVSCVDVVYKKLWRSTNIRPSYLRSDVAYFIYIGTNPVLGRVSDTRTLYECTEICAPRNRDVDTAMCWVDPWLESSWIGSGSTFVQLEWVGLSGIWCLSV